MTTPEIDYTAAADAAGQAFYAHQCQVLQAMAAERGEALEIKPWDELDAVDRSDYVAHLLPALQAAGPHLASQGWDLASAYGIVLDPNPYQPQGAEL